MSQLSHFCAHSVRLGQGADVLRDLADRMAHESDMQTVKELLGDAVSELAAINRQYEAAMKRATEMHDAITVCHEGRRPITESAPATLPLRD